MTVDDMRMDILKYCDTKDNCRGCPLFEASERFQPCFGPAADDARIIKNYAIIFGSSSIADAVIFEPAMSKAERHEQICDEIKSLYKRKNADYGDSFHKTFIEEGMAMPRIRLSDKLERFKRLTLTNEQNVKDESIRDTLIDLANYAIMTILELESEVDEHC